MAGEQVCHACGDPFTVTRRRHHCPRCNHAFCNRHSSNRATLPSLKYTKKHHCRRCNHAFCNRHSSNRATLPSLKYTKKVRVCDACFDAVAPPHMRHSVSSSASVRSRSKISQQGPIRQAKKWSLRPDKEFPPAYEGSDDLLHVVAETRSTSSSTAPSPLPTSDAGSDASVTTYGSTSSATVTNYGSTSTSTSCSSPPPSRACRKQASGGSGGGLLPQFPHQQHHTHTHEVFQVPPPHIRVVAATTSSTSSVPPSSLTYKGALGGRNSVTIFEEETDDEITPLPRHATSKKKRRRRKRHASAPSATVKQALLRAPQDGEKGRDLDTDGCCVECFCSPFRLCFGRRK